MACSNKRVLHLLADARFADATRDTPADGSPECTFAARHPNAACGGYRGDWSGRDCIDLHSASGVVAIHAGRLDPGGNFLAR